MLVEIYLYIFLTVSSDFDVIAVKLDAKFVYMPTSNKDFNYKTNNLIHLHDSEFTKILRKMSKLPNLSYKHIITIIISYDNSIIICTY